MTHIIFPATHTRTLPVFTPQLQGVIALWLVVRLSRPGWLVMYRDKCPAPGIEPAHGQPSQY